MNVSEITAFIITVVITLFSWFPESEFISRLYGNIYSYNSISETIEMAIREENSQTVADMASPEMKKKYPDFKERLDGMFSDIKGDLLSLKYEEKRYRGESDLCYDILTTETEYTIYILYTAVDVESKHTEVGIRRVMLMAETDEYSSRWVNPEHYMASEVIEQPERVLTRRWACGNGISSDEYVFTVEENYSKAEEYSNVEIRISRNNGYGVPDFGYGLRDDDELKIWFIPEGENPSAQGEGKPNIVFDAQSQSTGMCYIEPGRYYLYVEPSDSEMYYTVGVFTKL